jgi:ribosomal protein L35AE/L33A
MEIWGEWISIHPKLGLVENRFKTSLPVDFLDRP